MKSIEMENKQFGRWTVIDRAENKKRKDIHWLCICSCGTRRVVSGYSLRIEDTKSCGCLNIEIARENMLKITGRKGIDNGNFKHGHTIGYKETPTYNSWERMIERCNNPKHDAYKYYGGRGIKVCDRWLKFENFLADMGERPLKHTIDRINPDGNYIPENCRWANAIIQRNNRSKKGEVFQYEHR